MLSRIKAKEAASLHTTFAQMIATGMAEMPDCVVPAASALHESLP
jgi:hypothetical protein